MTPGSYDLALYRGDSYTWRFVLWEDETKATAIDLAGVTVTAQWRDGVSVHDFACTVTLPNIVDVELPADAWEDVPASGVWDMQLTDDMGAVRTVVAGRVAVTSDVTRVTA